MIYEIEIVDEVFYDIEDAIIYYNMKVDGLGFKFYQVFQDTIEIIAHSPLIFNKKHKNYRQVRMEGFPYHIIYEVEYKRILISRVFHVKRNPQHKYKNDL